LKFTHLELVNLLCPCSWYFEVLGVGFFLFCFVFFCPPGALALFLREEYIEYVTPCRVLVVPIASFLPSVRGLEFPLFDEDAGALL
jgi:hypothetical protein